MYLLTVHLAIGFVARQHVRRKLLNEFTRKVEERLVLEDALKQMKETRGKTGNIRAKRKRIGLGIGMG